jgi:outer membrane protein assembly factor BamB
VRITAARPEDGSVLWQNDVGVPVAMMVPDPATSSIYAVTSQAALYQLSAGDLQSDSTLQPVENAGRSGVAQRFESPLDAGNGRYVMVNQETAEQLALLDPSRQREKLRLVTLSVPVGAKATAGSLMMAGGLLLPLDNGRIMLLNVENGLSLGSPFQPPVKPGQKVQWTTPVASPADPGQLLISDDTPTLFRLRVGDQIRELSRTEIGQRLLGPAAAVGSNWLAAAGGAAGDLLITYSTTTLEETGRQMMGSRIAFGPVSVDGAVLLQTADGKLHRVSAEAQIEWSLEVPGGAPVAAPLMRDGVMYVTGSEGWILAVDPATGEIRGQVEIGQPLSGNPLLARSQMLVPGAEGIIFVVDRPQ